MEWPLEDSAKGSIRPSALVPRLQEAPFYFAGAESSAKLLGTVVAPTTALQP